MDPDRGAEVRLVRAEPLSDDVRRHPLATRQGIALLVQILAADKHWRPLTTRQRDALRRSYAALLASVDGVAPRDVPQDGLPVELPALPADVHPATARSLERRGLARDGRLTALAVEVVQLADRCDDAAPGK